MSPRRIWKTAAWVFLAMAGAVGCVLPFLRWQPAAPFDVLGFLWILTNTPNLAVWAAALFLFAFSVYCGIRALFSHE